MTLILLIAGVLAVSALPTILTRFDYRLDDTERRLIVTMWWCGFIPLRKRVDLTSIASVSRVQRLRTIVPVLSGSIPSLWGQWRPRFMVAIRFRGAKSRLPLLLTPD